MFPVAHMDSVSLAFANTLLVAWGHRMGPLLRGNSGAMHCHALFVHSNSMAVPVMAWIGRRIELARTRKGNAP